MYTVEQQFFAIFPSAIISSFVMRIPYPSEHKLSISPINILIMYLSCVFFLCIRYVYSSYIFYWVILVNILKMCSLYIYSYLLLTL